MPSLLAHPAYVAALGLLCGVVGSRWGWRAAHRIVLPASQGALGFVAFATAWYAGGPIFATIATGGWAAGATIYSLIAFTMDREHVDERVFGAKAYRELRLSALDPHAPARPRWAALLAERARTIAPFAVLALLTANLLSLVFAAMLLNTMNAYVTALVASARRRSTAAFWAWDGWHLARGAALVLLGSACAAPLASWQGHRAPGGDVRRLLYLAGIGLALDLILEILVGPTSRRLLGRALRPTPPAAAE